MPTDSNIGWGSDRHSYTLAQIECLIECFDLNGGVMSRVVGCALGNRELFSHIKTANDVEFLLTLIERRMELRDSIKQQFAYANRYNETPCR